jgi:uncharacterized iron-regulated membrane protein
MIINPRVWLRKWHRWGAAVVAAPFLVVILTGLLLQLKKEIPWVQPPEQTGSGKEPQISFAQILEAVRNRSETDVQTWEDIDRVDVRPGRGMLKVICRNNWEVQLDARTGEVLQVAFRRSDIIESIHDGSWFHADAKIWVFFVCGVIVLTLWLTGIYLFILPFKVRWSRRKVLPVGHGAAGETNNCSGDRP